MSTDDLRYPIGIFQLPASINTEQMNDYIFCIQTFPGRLTDEVSTMSDEQLDTPYRDGGWTVRQLIHHCADSHMNSFIRFKLTMTEDTPTIKPYYEDRWAELPDVLSLSIEHSLILLDGLHARWTVLLKSLLPTDLKRTFFHPQNGKEISLRDSIALYAWHSNHHLAHITSLKKRKGWT